jgi:hypothetical protein
LFLTVIVTVTAAKADAIAGTTAVSSMSELTNTE